jgi:membrane protein
MDSVPGALLASCGWQVFSQLYSIYVAHFSVYSNIYGSVYGVALSMLWLYCCISIVFYGGALNMYLMKNKKD